MPFSYPAYPAYLAYSLFPENTFARHLLSTHFGYYRAWTQKGGQNYVALFHETRKKPEQSGT